MQINNIFFNFLKQFQNKNDIFVLMNYLDLLLDTYRNDYSKFKSRYYLYFSISYKFLIKTFIIFKM